MNTSSIGSASNAIAEVEAQQTTIRKVTTDLGGGNVDVSAFEQDGTLAAKENATAAPVAPETTFNTSEISLSSFLWAFKAGNKIELDGPLSFNGEGTIKQLDKNTLEMSITGAIGNGTIKLERKEGNTFTATVALGKKPFKMEMKASMNGNKLTFVDKWNPDKKLHFTRDGQDINLNPDGMSIPGSVDISKK
jgi:hypothetical protein